MENIINELLDLVKKKMKEQGVYDHEGYKSLVEETIEYFIEKGKIHEDENIEFIKDRCLEQWEIIQ